MAALTGTGSVSANDWTNVLAEVPLFAGLPKRHLKAIAKLARIQRVAAYSEIVRAGDPGDAFYLILDGTVTVRPPRRRAVTLGSGAYFGELALITDAPRSATVVADGEEVLVARIGSKGFAKLLENEPKVSVRLLRTLAGRLQASESSASH